MLTLRRAPSVVVQAPPLDDVQLAALAHRGGLLRVLGGPGTGKTTTAIEAVVARVESGEATPDQCLILTSSRVAAGSLRERVTSRLGGTSTEPLARTHQALGFGILRQAAALRGDPTPRLLSGPEQDVILRELLAGHAEEGTGPDWPERVHLALGTRGFRGELRDLLMRAVEHDLEPADLVRLGREHGRPEWVAAADVLAEYDEVTALSAPGAYDPAWILGAAADLLQEDPAARGRLVDGLRLVVVDDAQELTSAAARLLRTIASPGLDLILLGDPDSAVQTFRGADPRHLSDGWTQLATAGEPRTLVLPTAYRLPQALVDAAARVAPKIGALGGGLQRGAAAGRAGGQVDVRLLRAVSQEASYVAAELREAHLRFGIPWSEMAVIVRGQGRTATLRRVLMAAGVPVAGTATDLPVRDEVAVRPLLALLGVVLDLARGATDALDPEVAVDTLLSPIGGADAVGLRRLRRAQRRIELGNGGGRTSDELLAAALVAPGALIELGPEAIPARRVAATIAAGVKAARGALDGSAAGDGDPVWRWEPGVTAESVLWAMWAATGLGAEWQATALGGGSGAARADRDLDAVVGLFDAAAKFVDRLPQAGPEEFLTHIGNQDIPGDTLVARSPVGESVTVTTPQAAAGRQWHLVVVAGVQEGVWPDLRLRGSLLGSEHLVDVVSGRATTFRAAQAAVRYDETRSFLVALTRASDRVIVTAVRSDDEQPSVYLDVVDPETIATQGDRRFAEVARTMTLPTLVGELRRQLVSADSGVRATAVAALARLTHEGVPGADPSQWWALREVSDDRPLRAQDQEVRVSPSKVESFGSCGLRWLLGSVGGDGPSVGAADIGTLVHDIAAELGDVDADTLVAEVDARWGRLGMPAGWVSDRKRHEAHGMVRRLATYFEEARAAGWVRLGAELDMKVVLGRAVLSGKVDRIEGTPDGTALRVVDYKTGSSKPRAEELARHPQLGAYQLGVESGAFGELGDRSAGAALLQVGKAALVKTTLQTQDPLRDDADPQWAADLVTGTAEGMAGSTFAATVGDWCKLCQVKASCPAQPEGRVL
ncbi:superfamily I DNA/RNA helicase/RecB family exonuclease [Phycicoccus badiiscoriae]|uniref:DNA 3'-5' helicase n=1 Tax=Pedococcus badiiscoriae TaxID=642776 RepID=A0A852WHQ3_9MICO|nr:ATP-dependent DNA helicase [Pedococcus badiiscoriae]NYG06194.1 superfamily I DNA/RNA helicase/RecB family exonuclease [Pedococcus badiiscoriae]